MPEDDALEATPQDVFPAKLRIALAIN
jgi:hypothetical protein